MNHKNIALTLYCLHIPILIRKEGRKVKLGLCATVLALSSIADWMKLSGDVGMGPFAHQSIFSSQQYLVTLSSSLNFMGLERSGPHRTLLACFLHYAWNPGPRYFQRIRCYVYQQIYLAWIPPCCGAPKTEPGVRTKRIFNKIQIYVDNQIIRQS